MQCMNYHQMDKMTILSRLEAMREWFRDNIGHHQWSKVEFAFQVAENALVVQDGLSDEGRREYQQVIDNLC